jgi:hypothetical protein
MQITSDATPAYNCIAWAAADQTKWWWPSGQYHWPHGIRMSNRIASFISLFESLGYLVCNDPSFVAGEIKVAIYADRRGNVTHAARQVDEMFWTSKLGSSADIAHELDALEGGPYGNVQVIMSRKMSSS